MTERQAVAREEVALPVVEVEDLAKIFDVSPPLLNRLLQGQGRALLTAVDHVSFRIPRGTTFSLVGESGCGKSTVARLVVGLHRPSGGRVLFDGCDLAAVHARPDTARLRQRLPMNFQDPYAQLRRPSWREKVGSSGGTTGG